MTKEDNNAFRIRNSSNFPTKKELNDQVQWYFRD